MNADCHTTSSLGGGNHTLSITSRNRQPAVEEGSQPKFMPLLEGEILSLLKRPPSRLLFKLQHLKIIIHTMDNLELIFKVNKYVGLLT